MDYQNSIVDRMGSPELLATATRAVDAARANGVRVLFVRVAFRPGFPEVAPANKAFGGIAARAGTGFDEAATAIHDAFGMREDDLLVTKRRVSAFTGSDLEVLLRGLGARHLVLAGIATSGVVLSTLRQAADLDFELTVLEDACADADPEVHRVLVEKVFPRQAEVTTTDAWVSSLAS
ncbi:cysteine hydrolase [Curtobacterium sp. ISL-83]|nr:cysteine hydrolase [Curtobacterium sp. ISL-83]